MLVHLFGPNLFHQTNFNRARISSIADCVDHQQLPWTTTHGQKKIIVLIDLRLLKVGLQSDRSMECETSGKLIAPTSCIAPWGEDLRMVNLVDDIFKLVESAAKQIVAEDIAQRENKRARFTRLRIDRRTMTPQKPHFPLSEAVKSVLQGALLME